MQLGLGIRPPAMLKPMFRGLCKFFTMQVRERAKHWMERV